MRNLDRIRTTFLGSSRKAEMLVVGIALVLLVVIDTGSPWLWITPLLVAAALLLFLRRHGPRPST